jgi:hypothetical protein
VVIAASGDSDSFSFLAEMAEVTIGNQAGSDATYAFLVMMDVVCVITLIIMTAQS